MGTFRIIGGVLFSSCLSSNIYDINSIFVVFRVLGANYDAAVMCSGLCGHGLGATPSAIVNMTAINEKYGMSRKAMMIVPIVGAFFGRYNLSASNRLVYKDFCTKLCRIDEK